MIKNVKGGSVIVHCHGKDKGKRIAATKKPVSKRKARQIHRAITANKVNKGSILESVLRRH